MKKRFIGALLALCMIVGLLPSFGAFALDDDATPQLIVSTETAKPGDEVTISISTANNPGLGVITIPIHYDESKLEYVGFENAGFTGWVVVKNAVWLGDEDSYFNGVILKLKFRVLDDAEAGLASVSVECRPGDAYNYAEEPIMFETVSGGVEVQHVHAYVPAVTDPTCTEKGYTTYTCACGDSYVDDYVDALGHDFGEWAVTKEATCTEAGEEARACSRCDVVETREISALGHKWDDGVVTAEPTEETEGVKTYTCTVCGETRTEKIPVLEHVHDYSAVVTEPTCTEKGYTTYTCRCGDSYVDDYVDALGHDFGEWAVTKEATCTEAGEETRLCSRCDVVETREISALGHKWNDGVVTTEPTEETEGVKTYTCTVCGEIRTEKIPMLEHVHDYSAVVTEPTCTEKGYTTYTCRCGDSYVDDYVDALGHDFGEWAVTKEATCMEAGEEARACSRCDATETRAIAALGHDFGEWAVTKEATCTEAGEEARACSRCDTVETKTLPALGHKTELRNAKEATCTEAGYTGDEVCTVCGETIKAGEIIAALGHKTKLKNTKEATCTEAGYTGDEVCTVCNETVKKGKVIAALGHKWDDGKVTTAPTATTDGVKTYTCTVCGETKTEAIPATGEQPIDPVKPIDPTTVFTDVSHNWAYPGIEYCYNHGLMAGTSETTFSPEEALTRGQFVAILWRQLGCPAPKGESPFTDLTLDYYKDAIAWAAENKVVYGTSATTFEPDRAITRQELTAMFYRYVGEYLKQDVSGAADISTFPDYSSVSSYAQAAMAWAKGVGLITGNEIGGTIYLDPLGAATRAQAATMFMNLCERVLK